MSFYHAVAENGPSVCPGPNKLVQCGNNFAGIPHADRIILSDSIPATQSFGLEASIRQ